MTKRLRNSRGASLPEYALLISIIGLAATLSLSEVQVNAASQFTRFGDALNGSDPGLLALRGEPGKGSPRPKYIGGQSETTNKDGAEGGNKDPMEGGPDPEGEMGAD